MIQKRSLLSGAHFLNGDVACAEGAVAAGCRFFAGYPITPATEIAEHLSERMPEFGGIYIQMEDEIASMAAVIGASYAGLKSMTATSGPGFSLMQENIGLAIMTETPCVIVDIMRGGPSTGQPTLAGQQDVMQARWGSHGDYETIAFSPCSVQEMFDLTIEAFNMSETYRIPAMLMGDEIVAHMYEKLVIPPPGKIQIKDRKRPTVSREEYLPFKPDLDLVPPMACFGDGYRFHATGLTHNERGYPQTQSAEVQQELVTRLCDKIRRNSEKIIKTQETLVEDADVVIVAYGIVARAALSAVRKARKEGIKAGLLRLITLWPFAERRVADIGNRVKAFVVPEMNCGQMVLEVERASKGTPVAFVSKLGGEPHTPLEILQAIRRNSP
jgi:2-oxoglutarate ferredoxin oxidoreductase subunit alpha